MAEDTMKLVLIRHGESEWNKLNLFTGWTDVELSETGEKEAAAGGRALKEAGFDFDICYTSRLKRAIHTLNFVLKEMDREWLPVVKSWKLNERHYGALQGLNKADAAAKHGDEQVLIWRRSFDICPPELEPGDERDPHTQEQPWISLTYFVPDDRKEGGKYVTVQSTVKKIKEYERQLVLADERIISMSDIVSMQFLDRP